MSHLPGRRPRRHGVRRTRGPGGRVAVGARLVAGLLAALVTAGVGLAPAHTAQALPMRDAAYGLSAVAAEGPSRSGSQQWMAPTAKGPYAGPTVRSRTIDLADARQTERTSSARSVSAVLTATSEHYLPTPYTAQPNGYTCGPTSVHMALALHNASPGIWPLARELGTTTEGTGPTPIVTQSLRNHTGAPYETATIPWNGGAIDPADTRRLWDNVVEDVDGGYAIVAYVYAPAHQYPYHDVAYPLEHYFVVDGYDTSYGTVRISDPANFNGRSRFWITVDQLAYLIAGTPGYAW